MERSNHIVSYFRLISLLLFFFTNIQDIMFKALLDPMNKKILDTKYFTKKKETKYKHFFKFVC